MNEEFQLIQHDNKLTICWQTEKKPLYLNIDFLHGSLAYRQKQSLHKEGVIKAMGIKKDFFPYIVDATAGLGRDAFILASTGCQVTLIEQHPMVAAILEDALKRLLNKQPLNMNLIQGDAVSILANLDEKPDIIYLDPLFPPRPKTALVKKEMQILQRLTHESLTATEALFAAALKCAKRRVVVKRPNYAPALEGKNANYAIKMPHHRFDVYRV